MTKSISVLALVAGALLICAFAIPDAALAVSGLFAHSDHSSFMGYAAEVGAAATLADVKALGDKLKEVTDKFNAKSDELSTKAEQAMTEVKDKGTLLTETKATVDKLLVEHTVLTKEKNELHSKLSETEARLSGLEQEVARKPGGGTVAARKSIGAQMAGDEKLKAFASENPSVGQRYRFSTKMAITSVDYPSTGPGIVAPQIVPGTLPILHQRLFIRDLLTIGQTDSPAIFWVQVTGFTNNAAVVAENTLKPSSTIAYESKITPVRTIAHLFKASKQILADFKQLQSDVDSEMRFGVKYAEEREVLFGDGTGQHLDGIVPQASAFDPAFAVDMQTNIDDIRLAMLQAQLARLPATGIVMHFMDWAKTELTKDANGNYIFANPLRLAGPNLWGLPVVPTEIAEFEGNFLTGAFRDGAMLYDREEANVEIASENNDDFEKNMLTIRCEERVALAVKRPEAFIYGAFTNNV